MRYLESQFNKIYSKINGISTIYMNEEYSDSRKYPNYYMCEYINPNYNMEYYKCNYPFNI